MDNKVFVTIRAWCNHKKKLYKMYFKGCFFHTFAYMNLSCLKIILGSSSFERCIFPCLLALNVTACLLHLFEWSLLEYETWGHGGVVELMTFVILRQLWNLNQITKYPQPLYFPTNVLSRINCVVIKNILKI